MNKKIFQIFFFLIVLTAFGVVIKNYVDSIESDIDDYTQILEDVPQSKISRLAPIIIRLAQDIDDQQFPIDEPIQNSIIQFNPPINGYTYFTNKRTLEFQPNEPLPAGNIYTGRLDVNKIFPKVKLKPFKFKFSTPASSFKVNITETVYYDTTENHVPYLIGHITFNDYVDFNNKQKLIEAYQNNRKLPIVYSPNSDKHSVKFIIKDIKRTNNNEKINIEWTGKPINSKINDSTTVNIASLNTFKVIYCKLRHFPQPILTVRFTDPIYKQMIPDSFLTISQLNDYKVIISQNEISIYFKNITEKTHNLFISRALLNSNGIALNSDFNFTFQLTHPYPFISFYDTSHYVNPNKSINLIDIKTLNLKKINVEITHVPDKNMIQFLQVNNLINENELERVGKIIYNKTFNLQTQLNYNPKELTTYNLNLLGADLSKNGMYNYEFSYNTDDIVFNLPDTAIAYDSIRSDKKINKKYIHNIVYSELYAIAKRTTLDSLSVFVSSRNTGLPIKKAHIEVYDYQQNKLAILQSDNNGVAKAKISNQNLFIRVQYNSQVTYIKLNNSNHIIQNSISSSGVKTNKGLLCYIEGLKPSYSPADSLQIGIILKKNGKSSSVKENLEIKLVSPKHFFFSTHITPALGSSLTLYKGYLPNNCKQGKWKLIISYGKTEFQYPFNVIKENKFVLPVKFSINNNKNLVSVLADTKTDYLNSHPVNITITPLTDSLKPYFTLIKNNLPDKMNNCEYKTLLNKYGKAEFDLPNWIKAGVQFQLTAKVNLHSGIVMQKDTVLSIKNILAEKTDFNTVASSLNSVAKANNNIKQDKNIVLPIKLHINKSTYKIGDSCHIEYKSTTPINALATIENSTGIFYAKWVKSTSNMQKISFIIPDEMLPGFYISFLPYNLVKYTPTVEYISVLNAKNTNNNTLVADIPHDWLPGSKVPIHISNTGNAMLNYFIYISYNDSTIKNKKPVYEYFNQKQQNSIITWSSDYINEQKTDNNLSYKRNNCIKNHNAINQTSTAYKPQLILGPYFIDAENKASHTVSVPEIQGTINVKIIGIETQKGRVIEISKLAAIYEPVTIKAKLPKFINAGDFVELPITLYNKSVNPDTLLIEINSIKNIELYSNAEQQLIINKNEKVSFTLKFMAKKVLGTAQLKISAKSGINHSTKIISIPIQSNPNYLIQNASAIIPVQKPWQQTIVPLGIKGTNTAKLEVSNFNIPNIWKIIQSLDKNSSNNLTCLINKTFPLIYLNSLIIDAELNQQFSKNINKTLTLLSKYQTKEGGFLNLLTNSEPTEWLTNYTGEFMLEAKKNGYKINEGVLNRWKRYQQRELQKLKFLYVKENNNQAYIIYTLTQCNLVGAKQLNECLLQPPNQLINRLYLTKSLSLLGKTRTAKSLLKADSVKNILNKLSILENSLLLTIVNNLNLNDLSPTLIKHLNTQIKNKNNTPYKVVMALNSILKTMLLSGTKNNNKLTYQINNGKEIPYNSNNLLSYIAIPLEFTLPKHIDLINTGSDTLYINLVHTGSSQKITGYYGKSNKLKITNQYYYLDNSEVNTLNFNNNELYKQVITYKNLGSRFNQNLIITIPKPCGVELIYTNMPLLTDENHANNNGLIKTELVLKPLEIFKIVIVYKTKFKGQYTSYPIKTFNNSLFYSEMYTQQSNIKIR